MTVSELLRKLANILDDESEISSEEDGNYQDDTSMVPPLQQKHELLKKATGVENSVDAFALDTDECGCDGLDNDDDLSKILKIAGLNNTADSDESINDEVKIIALSNDMFNIE